MHGMKLKNSLQELRQGVRSDPIPVFFSCVYIHNMYESS